MMEAPNKAIEIKAAVTAFLAFGTALFGWVGWLIVLWVCAMLLDYLTGTAAAIKNGQWESKLARQGLWHKLGSISAVLVAALADIALKVIVGELGVELEYSGYVTPIVVTWYIFTELGSVIENAARLGVPVPEFLRKMIERIKNAAEDEGGKLR